MTEITTTWDEKVIVKTKWCHFLQSSEWASVKSKTVWRAKQHLIKANYQYIPCIVYSRAWPVLGRIHYLPKLATLSSDGVSNFTAGLKEAVKTGIAIRLEIDQPYSEALHNSLLAANWLPVSAIQYEETVLVNLDRPVEEMLLSFKKRARREINIAERAGVTVKKVEATPENMDFFYNMLEETSKRGNFTTRSHKFSTQYWNLLVERGIGQLYFAKHQGDVLCAAYVVKIGSRGFYKDGASTRLKPNLSASRYMQWAIMQDLQKAGCKIYDLCGIPAAKHMDAGNRGYYLFKTAFGDATRLQGGYILPLSQKRYKLWARLEPNLLKLYIVTRKDLWY